MHGHILQTSRVGVKAMSKRASYTLRVRWVALVSLAGSLALYALLLFAYTPEQDNVNGPVPSHWPNNSVTWYLNPTAGSNVDQTGGSVAMALQSSFSTWQNSQLAGKSLVFLTVTQGPNSSITDPNSSDCLNVVSFMPSSSVNFPTGAIAFTDVATVSGPPPTSYNCTQGGTSTTQTCSLPSCVVDGDIAFNPKENFSTRTPTPSGSFDVQSVSTHEIGHLLGLDHSGLAQAMMYPFGDTGQSEKKTLATDDAAGIAFLYPSPAFSVSTGTISGQVNLSGSGAFAAHVLAIDANTGNVVIDGLTNASTPTTPAGSYKLVGLPQGSYNILVLPLAPDVNSGIYILDDFSGWSCGYGENSAPCCDPTTPACTGKLSNPTNYTGAFF
jgi:matrixin